MVGIEVAVGFLAAWSIRKARRAAAGVDGEIDEAIDSGLETLHNLISKKLHPDRALSALEQEAPTEKGVTARTQKRVELALEAAVEDDTEFAGALERAVEALSRSHGPLSSFVASPGATSIVGNVDISAKDHGTAAWQIGTVASRDHPDPRNPRRKSD